MKHLILKIIACFCSIGTSNAQVTISTSDLNGTKWQLQKRYAERSKEFYEYKDGLIIWNWDNGDCFVYQYYLSETIPTKFDSSKVGKSTKGRYLIRYNPIEKNFFCLSIQEFSKSQKIMTLKLEDKDIIGTSNTSTYKLITNLNRSEIKVQQSRPNTRNNNNKSSRDPIEAIR